MEAKFLAATCKFRTPEAFSHTRGSKPEPLLRTSRTSQLFPYGGIINKSSIWEWAGGNPWLWEDNRAPAEPSWTEHTLRAPSSWKDPAPPLQCCHLPGKAWGPSPVTLPAPGKHHHKTHRVPLLITVAWQSTQITPDSTKLLLSQFFMRALSQQPVKYPEQSPRKRPTFPQHHTSFPLSCGFIPTSLGPWLAESWNAWEPLLKGHVFLFPSKPPPWRGAYLPWGLLQPERALGKQLVQMEQVRPIPLTVCSQV